MNILITGNSGYIGSHLTKLLSADHTIYGLDRKNPIIPVTNHSLVDVRYNFRMEATFDCVIHLAAAISVAESELNPVNYYATNLTGTLNALAGLDTRNFIFASTGAADQCLSPYGTSKRAAEDCIKEICKAKDLPYTIFRFYNVVGSSGINPTNPDGLFYNLIKARDTGKFTLFGNDYNTKDGTAVRDYVHVDEICHSIRRAITEPSNKIENLGHGVGHTVKEMVDIFKNVNNTDFDVEFGPRRQGDLEYSVLDQPSKYMLKLYNLEDLLRIT